jgi:tetratricopeptide (TPR) repeat protein
LHFRRAVEIRKDFYDAYLSWGATLLEWAKTQQGQMSDKLFNESCEKYKKAAALRPDFYWAYAGWGTVLFEWAKTKEGQMSDKLFSESCEKFKKAAALRPDLSDGYAGWGTAMLGWAEKKGTDENLLKGAIAMLMKAEKLKRGSAAYNLACAWCILGDQDQCSRWLKVGEEEKTLPKRQVAIEDPDLKAIRDKEWFGLIRWDSE